MYLPVKLDLRPNVKHGVSSRAITYLKKRSVRKSYLIDWTSNMVAFWVFFNNVSLCIADKMCSHVNPAAAGPPRHLPAAGGGVKLPPSTSAKISSQRDEIEKRNFAHIFLNI